MKLRLTTVKPIYPPFTYFPERNGHVPGIFSELFGALCNKWNMSCSWMPYSRSHLTPLDHEEVEVVLYPVAIRKNPASIITADYADSAHFVYTADFVYKEVKILSGRTFRTDENLQKSLLSLNSNVWLCCFFLLTVIGLVLWMQDFQHRKSKNWFAFLDIIWKLCGCIFAKTLKRVSTRCSVRILMILWFNCIFITASMFGSNLKSGVTISDRDKIDRLEDILKKPDIRPVIVPWTHADRLFKDAEDGVMRQIMERSNGYEAPKNMLGYLNLFNEIAKGKIAFIHNDYDLKSWLGELCELNTQKTFYFGQDLVSSVSEALLFRGNIPHLILKDINVRLRRIGQARLVEHEHRRSKFNSDSCLYNPSNLETSQVISMRGISSAFFIWLTGLGIATGILICEIFVKIWKSHA